MSKKNNYGPLMKELQDKIEKTKGWKEKPIGPLGQYISVPSSNAKYATLIEHILNPHLYDFIVYNQSDFTKLKELIRQVYSDGQVKGKTPGAAMVSEFTTVSGKIYSFW